MKAAVQFDIDGVLADFIKGYLKFANRLGLIQCDVIGDADNPHYGTAHVVGSNFIDDVVWRKIKESPSFWYDLPRSEGVTTYTFRRINALQDERDVYFTTNRMGLHSRWQTIEWLHLWGVNNPTVVLMDRKGEFARAARVGYSIEDKAGNAVYIAYESPTTTSCLINRLYNRFDAAVLGSKVRRVDSVEEFLDLIESEDK